MGSPSVDRQTFEAFVHAYDRRIFHAVYGMVNDYEDAMDITQTVFTKAYEKLATFNPDGRFYSWLHAISVHESINHLKKKRRTIELADDVEDTARSPEQELVVNRTGERLQQALARLTVDHRAVVVLKYFLELSYEEIGRALGIPVRTVKSRLYAARQQLKGLLVERGSMP